MRYIGMPFRFVMALFVLPLMFMGLILNDEWLVKDLFHLACEFTWGGKIG